MKKTYSTPTIEVVTLQQQGIICTSDVSSASGNADMNYEGGGTVPVRVRQHTPVEWDDWDDWDE